MSLHDGKIIEEENLYITSDLALASYLMTRGYELWNAIDGGKVGANGRPRLELALRPSEEILDIEGDVRKKYDEYENVFFVVPYEPDSRVNFKSFWNNTRVCLRVINGQPVRRD